MKAAARNRRGFTILEVMVALVLLSIISLTALEAYRAGLGLWQRQDEEGTGLDTARALLGKLETQVKSARPWRFLDEGGRHVLYFRGGKDAVEFITLVGLSSERGVGSLHAVRYALVGEEGGEKGPRLLVEEYAWPRRGFPEGEEPVIREEIGGVSGFVLGYVIGRPPSAFPVDEAAAGGGEKETVEAWPPEGGPKTGETLAAVSLSIKMDKGGGELSMIAPVMSEWLEEVDDVAP